MTDLIFLTSQDVLFARDNNVNKLKIEDSLIDIASLKI